MVTTVSLEDALLSSAREVFETMVFMALEKAGVESEGIGDEAILGSITFKGNLEGCLGICFGMECARNVAANMLAVNTPEDLSEADICDAIGEIANMIMGSLKSRIQEEVGEIEVSIPSVVRGQHLKNRLGEGTQEAVVKVNIEDQYCAVFSLLYRQRTE